MPTLYTIGHSTHSLKDFLALLKTYHIEQVIDIRSIPKSRHVPWFNQKPLHIFLRKNGIGYIHFKALGGLRHAQKDSINQGWYNTSFRGFADYMQTKAFYQGIKNLNQIIKKKHTVIMCAEALPWRCHRSLIGDAEIIRGIRVIDIMNVRSARVHQLTAFAVVDRTRRPMKIYYPLRDNLKVL